MARTISIEIVGDAKSLTRAFHDSEKAADRFGSSLSGKLSKGLSMAAKGAAVAGAAIGAAFAATVTVGVKSLIAHEKALAQTQAALKSTGGAANVTAKQILGLADALEKKTGMDDLAIQSAENLLLTFTNVRNEVGKGNDIFNQATKTVVDMSVALGQDASSSAIQLGKALNDPIKGITALSRVGVSFTQQQKDQIKTLVESGDTLKAQKIILAELAKEFGGSGVAAGKTFAGQIEIIKARFEEFAESIASRVMPFLQRFADFAGKIFKADSFSAGLKIALEGLKSIGTDIFNAVRDAISNINWSGVWSSVQSALTAIADFRATALAWAANLITSATAAIGGIPWQQVFAGIGTFIGTLATQISGFIARVPWGQVTTSLGNALVGALKGVITLVKAIQWGELASNVLNALKAAITGMVNALVPQIPSIFLSLGKALLEAARQVIVAVANFWKENPELLLGPLGVLIMAIGPKIKSFFGNVFDAAKELGKKIIDGIVDGVGNIVEKIRGFFQDVWSFIKGAAGSAFAFAFNIGTQIVSGIWDGIKGKLGWLKDQIGGFFSGLFSGIDVPFFSPLPDAAAEVGKQIPEGIAKGIDSGWAWVDKALKGLLGKTLSSVSAATGQVQGAMAKWFSFSSVGGVHETSGLPGFPALDFMGTGPVRMPFNATITRTSGHPGYSGGFGGRSIYFTDEKGVRYFMTHLDWQSSAGLGTGPIAAGTLLGGVEPGAGHIHVGSSAGAPTWLQSGGAVPAGMDGMTTSVSSAMDKLAAKIKATIEKIGDTFTTLKDKALAAFDKITEGYESPARKLLNANQKAHEELLRQEEKAAIERRIASATNEEERQAALKELREFEFQENQRHLEETATQEENAWAKRREKERGQLEKALDQFLKHLGNKKMTGKQALKELADIFEEFGLKSGDKFIGGLGPVIKKLKDLINELNKEVDAAAGKGGGGGGGGNGGPPSSGAGSPPGTPGQGGVPADIGDYTTTPTPTAAQIDRAKEIAKKAAANRKDSEKEYIQWFIANFGPVSNYGRGGVFTRATMGMFGERGPEAILPLKNVGALSSVTRAMGTHMTPAARDAMQSAMSSWREHRMAGHPGALGGWQMKARMERARQLATARGQAPPGLPGSASVGDNIVIHVHGDILSEGQLIDKIRAGLALEGKRSGGALGRFG